MGAQQSTSASSELEQYHVRRTEGAPTFTLSAVVRLGTAHLQAPHCGAAQLLQHMAQQGTAAYPHPDSIEMALDSVGGTLSATCAPLYTLFTLHAPKQHARLMVRIMAEMIMHPLLDESTFDVQAMVFEEAMRKRGQQPIEQTRRWLQLEPIPSSGIPLATIRSLWATYYDTKHLVFLVSGDWDGPEAALFDWIGHYFGPLEACGETQGDSHSSGAGEVRLRLQQLRSGAAAGQHLAPPPLSSAPLAFRYTHNASAACCSLFLGYPVQLRHGEPAHFALEVLSDLLGGGKTSRLQRRSRECRAWARRIHTHTEIAPSQRPSWLLICAEVSADSCASTAKSLLQAAHTFWKAITVDEVEHSKQRMVSKLDMLTDMEVARRLATQVAQDHDIMPEREQYLRVTAPEVVQLARSMLAPSSCRLFVSATSNILEDLGQRMLSGLSSSTTQSTESKGRTSSA
jgi:predicted Zn-dependent peptidase